MMRNINKNLKKLISFLGKEINENTWFFIALLLVGSFILRIWQIGSVQEEIFDEVYFVKFAKNYLSGTSFFDIHPPLGKLIIASAIKLFGDKFFAWRVMEAIFGTLVILFGYLIGKEIKNKIAGLFTALILALDGMILVYSRVGLMDIFMIFFIMAGFYTLLKFANNKKLINLILAGVFLSLASSVKYIGGLLIFVYIFIIVIRKISIKKYWWKLILFLIIVPTIIYLTFFIFNFSFDNTFISKVLEWHSQSLNYNITLKDGHPYGSKWWTWFLLIRPIWFYFKEVQGNYIGIVGLGNPLAWWASLVVIPTLFYYFVKRDKNAFIILVSFIIFLIPWAFFNRVLFYYHGLPSFVFLSIGMGYLLEKLTHNKFGRVAILVFFAVLLFLFIFFLPIWMGFPLNNQDFYRRIWLKGWI